MSPLVPRRGSVLFAAALFAAACGPAGSSGGADGRRLTLTVFAAASLTEAFGELGGRFEASTPGVNVAFDFESSSALARKVRDGAPADVFASADGATMDEVVRAGGAVAPQVVARNRLAVLVAKGNPKQLRGLADLDRPGVVFLLCAPQVPCGWLGTLALDRAGVVAEPASFEANVKAVVAKVTLGEADAGVVYATDVRAAGGEADGVDVEVGADPDLEATYPVAVVRRAAHPLAARQFVDFVLSAEGQAILARFGFRAP